jgi:hypothetical protein
MERKKNNYVIKRISIADHRRLQERLKALESEEAESLAREMGEHITEYKLLIRRLEDVIEV